MSGMTCPNCGGECECDQTHNGVGMQQCGPWECPKCHWYERTEPGEADGEDFRGGEAAAYDREQQADCQRNLK